jgi:hypothetical protein
MYEKGDLVTISCFTATEEIQTIQSTDITIQVKEPGPRFGIPSDELIEQ